MGMEGGCWWGWREGVVDGDGGVCWGWGKDCWWEWRRGSNGGNFGFGVINGGVAGCSVSCGGGVVGCCGVVDVFGGGGVVVGVILVGSVLVRLLLTMISMVG